MKKIAVVCLVAASVTMLTGCGVKNESKVDTPKVPVVESNSSSDVNIENKDKESNEGINNVEDSKKAEEVVDTKKEDTLESFKLYYYDAVDDKIKSEDIQEKTIDEQLILSKLKEKNVLKQDVKINKIDKEDNVAIIDFNSAFINYNLGSGVEQSTLEAVAKSFIDGLNLEKLKITVDGKSYESGHIQLEDDYYFVK